MLMGICRSRIAELLASNNQEEKIEVDRQNGISLFTSRHAFIGAFTGFYEKGPLPHGDPRDYCDGIMGSLVTGRNHSAWGALAEESLKVLQGAAPYDS